jgi:hypothetical protein
MFSTKDGITKRAGLVFILSLFLEGPAFAQMTSGPGLSSGSGAGTGAGGSSGVLRNRSGSLSGVGPGPAGAGMRGAPLPPLTGSRRQPPTSFGPGVDVTFPNDPFLIPFMTMETSGMAVDSEAPVRITTDLLKDARMITDPEERSLALQRIANGAIASNPPQWSLAHKTIEEAITATSEVKTPLVRDQRLIAIVTSLTFLSDGLLRVGREPQEKLAQMEPDVSGPEALPKKIDANVLIRLARLEWRRAVYLASIIDNPTYRNEMLYKVSESQASGSASIANDYSVAVELRSLADRVPADDKTKGEKQPSLDDQAREAQAANAAFKKLADAILVDSFEDAKKIDRLIWKYRAMVRIALSAADSQQYERGIELSRGINNGESRAEAMLLLAESMCRKNQKELNERATVPYEEAARAVASVHQEGLRGVLVGFLVDSLIATGRFSDARACAELHPDPAMTLVALGAVAESQGRRGSAEAARRWIATEIPPQNRSVLYRRVTIGALSAIEQNRSKDFNLQDGAMPRR